MAVMTNTKFVEKCIDIAKNYKTIYVMGCFGAPISGKNVTRYCNNHEYNKQRERTSLIRSVANKGYFGFDCVNLIKSILWGWIGDASKTYGGATYASNGVPDTSANGMIKLCDNVSTNFAKIEIGEVVWKEGHIGVYIGDGLAVECTPSWENDVQITAVGNIGKKSGYNTRTWEKHGKLPYISYEKEASKPAASEKPATSAKPAATAKITKGCKVKVNKGAKSYTGASIASFVYNNVYTVDSLKGDRAVLDKDGICTPFNVKDLTLVTETPKVETPKKVTKGCKVKVKKGAKSYTGKSVASFVYERVYTVDELKGKRAVLDKNGICTPFNTDDLIVQ